MKECSVCRINKPETEYYSRGKNRTGLRSSCKSCHSKKCSETYEGRRENHLLVAYRYNLRTAYGITEDGYHNMFEKQGGKCLICAVGLANKFKNKKTDDLKGERVHVDHCHKTGKVRGLLCHYCNSGLGLFRDDPELLESAARYIRNAVN